MRTPCKLPLLSLAVLSLIAPSHASAQAHQPAAHAGASGMAPLPRSYTLAAFHIRGSQRFTEQEVIAASGLHLGEQVTTATLQQASERLGSSGAFATVQFQYSAAGAGGVQATFQLADHQQYVPASFENMVWWTPNDLRASIHARVPLFKGDVPLVGDLQEEVRSALEQIVQARGIHSKVTALASAPALGSLPTAIDYRIADVAVKIARVELPGISHADDPAVRAIVSAAIKTPFEQSFTTGYFKENLRALLMNAGFLAAEVGDPKVTLTRDDPVAPEVSLAVPVREGTRYAYAGTRFAGNSAFPSEELAKQVKFTAGAPVGLAAMQEYLRGVRKMYGTKGFIGMKYELVPDMKNDGTVIFAVAITEGDPYKMGNLQIVGVETSRIAEMQRLWKIPAGATYDDSYPVHFMVDIHKVFPQYSEVRYLENIRDADEAVDVQVQFRQEPK